MMRKGKSMGDGTRLETGRAMSLGGSTPRSRTRSDGRCVPGRAVRRGLPRSDRRVRLPRGALGNRLTVGSLTLNQAVGVRILLPESGAVAAGSDAAL